MISFFRKMKFKFNRMGANYFWYDKYIRAEICHTIADVFKFLEHTLKPKDNKH